MDTVTLKINGKEITAKAGQSILECVHEQELDRIPTLCHSPELAPYGSCFICVVELKGRPNLVPACATKVAKDMEIETRNERVIAARKTALELLISNHYADCISPCKEGCPAHVDAQGYIALCAMGEYEKAVNLIRESNPFPAACGRVCVRKCEIVCRREDVDSPVAINNIKRFVTDYPGVYDEDPIREKSRGKTIGIVGGGPSGLTAAWFLGRKGYDPVVYEMMEYAGGMLRYGIPEYRFPKDVLDKEIDLIARAGVTIKTGVKIGKDFSLDELMKKHDAVYVSVGAWTSKEMRVEGENDTEGVRGGIDFLIEKAKNPEKIKGTIVVVGGGNTAMDCARTSWRLGADKVIILYRRTKAEMPADKIEIEDCIKEGIEIYELAAPVGIIKDGNKLKALKCIRMKLGEPDSSGRRRPVPMEGSEFELPCDLALSAIGQEPVLDGITDGNTHSPVASKWNTLTVDPKTLQTNIEGLYAGGDAADDGPTVVIDAIADGQRAAKAIHEYLSGEKSLVEPFVVRKEFWSKPGKAELGEIKESPRHEVHEISVEERANSFNEVSTGYEFEDAVHETARCLSCGCLRYPDCDLRLYAEEYGVDMNKYKGYIRKHKVDDRHPYIVYDPNKCVLCARCIRTCDRILPISALGLVGRGFRTEMRPSMDDPLVETNCISCGNCVDSCPTGALLTKYPFPGRADLSYDEVETHCAGCSIGCKIRVRKNGNDRYYIMSSGEPGQYLCMYGRFINELFIQQKRVTDPVIRTGAKYRTTDWDEAYKKIVDSLTDIIAKHGPESVAVFASPELTNEELYLASRIAREGFGTNNIGSLAILETGLEAAILDESFGFTASTNDRNVLKDADVVFCNNMPSENNNLILQVDVLEAGRRGAKLIVSGSADDPYEPVTSLFLDPMRGRSSLMINSIIQVLLDDGFFNRETVSALFGGENFLADIYDYSPEVIADKSGVDKDKIVAAAGIIKHAEKMVFVHSIDRTKDASPGDMHVLANFVLLLRASGVRADILLPGIISNVAGVEIAGADPLFMLGRIPSPALPGAKSHVGLRKILEEGNLKAALVIGEDPMHDNRIASYFTHLEFLAVVDWAQTETTLYADVTLPGTTYLECSGTRCNYEGRRIDYTQAVNPRSGIEGWKVLADLAEKLGVLNVGDTSAQITSQIEKAVRDHAGSTIPFYWNTGQDRVWDGKGKLVVADTSTKPRPIRPPLTQIERYKREKIEVGIEYFKVHSQGVL